MAKNPQQPNTDSAEWLKQYLFDQWQRLRRHPDYIKFCDDQKSKFDEDGLMHSSYFQEARDIKKHYNLSDILIHYSKKLSENQVLNCGLSANKIYHFVS